LVHAEIHSYRALTATRNASASSADHGAVVTSPTQDRYMQKQSILKTGMFDRQTLYRFPCLKAPKKEALALFVAGDTNMRGSSGARACCTMPSAIVSAMIIFRLDYCEALRILNIGNIGDRIATNIKARENEVFTEHEIYRPVYMDKCCAGCQDRSCSRNFTLTSNLSGPELSQRYLVCCHAVQM
jgi:hypothetical protein